MKKREKSAKLEFSVFSCQNVSLRMHEAAGLCIPRSMSMFLKSKKVGDLLGNACRGALPRLQQSVRAGGGCQTITSAG